MNPQDINSLYLTTKEHLGQRLTLDSTVPEEVGCAEAVSYVLSHAGYSLPVKGIAGVNALIAYMLANGFQEIDTPSVGAVITAHSPNLTNPNFAHTGICLQYGIGSNSSSKGLFLENYTYSSWNAYFGENGSVTRYFLPVDNQLVPPVIS